MGTSHNSGKPAKTRYDPSRGRSLTSPRDADWLRLVSVLVILLVGVLAGVPLAASAAPDTGCSPGRGGGPSFVETQVQVGYAPRALPGTLASPCGSGRFPAMVLVAASGPMDRDETLGPNKPFRDLAQGLASRGVVTLRYDKRTLVHPEEFAPPKSYTVANEYVQDALLAARMLQRRDNVDPRRIFLLGHSQGGTVAPRIARAQPSLAGVVLLAAGVEPLEDAYLRQITYLAKLDGVVTKEEQAQIDWARGEVAAVKAITSSRRPVSTSRRPFGVPAAYWLDLNKYDPVKTAAALRQPLLILQGGRDYQVPVELNLVRWQKGLAGRRGVQTHLYPALNHFFLVGHGPPNNRELLVPGHVAPEVINDIAAWARSRR